MSYGLVSVVQQMVDAFGISSNFFGLCLDAHRPRELAALALALPLASAPHYSVRFFVNVRSYRARDWQQHHRYCK